LKRSVFLLTLVAAAACNEPVAPEGGSGSLTLNLCSAFGTGWFAYQNEGGAWTEVKPNAARQVSFDATSRVSVAMYRQLNGTSFTRVINATADELRAAMAAPCVTQSGTARLSGGIAGVTGSQYVRISAGPGTDVASVDHPAWLLDRLIPGQTDLIATRYATSTTQPATTVLVRRGIVPNGAVADLDFGNTVEARPLQFFNIGVANVTQSSVFVSSSIRTALGTNHSLGELSTTTGVTGGAVGFSIPALPQGLRNVGDLHQLYVAASNNDGTRDATFYYQLPAFLNFEMGPMIDPPALALLARAPYVRPRAQVIAKFQYMNAIEVSYNEASGPSGSRLVSVLTTAGFLGDTPTTWELAVPDLTSAGYDVNAGLHSDTLQWTVTARGGNTAVILGAPPIDGIRLLSAARSGAAIPASPGR
jgi:hypothetical protein